MTGVTEVPFVCSHRGDPRHPPVTIYTYVGPVPVPPGVGMFATRLGEEFSLDCPVCRVDSRPGEQRMRLLIEAFADRPGQVVDVSYLSV
jgi:hypothetical protein